MSLSSFVLYKLNTDEKLQMEVKMKNICDGIQSRGEVVQQSLHQYREVYAKVSQQSNRLLEVCNNIHSFFFSHSGLYSTNVYHQTSLLISMYI